MASWLTLVVNFAVNACFARSHILAFAESPAASGTPTVSATTETSLEAQLELEDSEPGELALLAVLSPR